MYFLIGFGIVGLVWSLFIYRVLVNVMRENEIKRNNEKYYNRKLNSIDEQIEKTQGKETGKTGTY
jgi:hypothetical protein